MWVCQVSRGVISVGVYLIVIIKKEKKIEKESSDAMQFEKGLCQFLKEGWHFFVGIWSAKEKDKRMGPRLRAHVTTAIVG